MLKFYTTYIITDLHNSSKQFCRIKVRMHQLRCCQCILHAHWQCICLSLCVEKRLYTGGGGGSRNRKNSKWFDFKIAYQLFAVKID